MRDDEFLDAIADALSDAGKLVILGGGIALLVFWPWLEVFS